jgi:hypothetical protein
MANIMNRTDAAKCVAKTERTLYDWEEQELLRFVGGFMTETALLNADRAARAGEKLRGIRHDGGVAYLILGSSK